MRLGAGALSPSRSASTSTQTGPLEKRPPKYGGAVNRPPDARFRFPVSEKLSPKTTISENGVSARTVTALDTARPIERRATVKVRRFMETSLGLRYNGAATPRRADRAPGRRPGR